MKKETLLLLLFLSACQVSSPEPSKQEQKPVLAEVARFEQEELYERITFAGTVRAKQETHLYAPLGGTIEQHFLEPGASVQKGEAILSIRPDSLGLEFRTNVVKAPISGTLIELNREPTEHIPPNEEIATIADLSELVVDIHATQSDLPFLHIGDELIVSTEDKETVGTILRIAQRPDRNSRSFPIRVGLQADPSIRLGTFVRAVAKKNIRKSYQVPLHYLQRNQTTLILLDDSDKAHWVEVKVGQIFGNQVEILEGLDDKSRVIGNFSRQPEEGEQVYPTDQE